MKDGAAFQTRFPTRLHLLEVAGREIQLLAPKDPDALLSDPAVESRYKADNYMPYWPIIWPSSLMMAEKIARDGLKPPTPMARAIELGCGLGLAGIAGASHGWHMTWTDYDPEAVEFAAHNALRNGIDASRIRALHMDWRQPLAERFDWIIASDVLYERRLHPLLLGAISALLAPGGEAWISDPDRTSAQDFPIAAAEAGFRVSTVLMEWKNFAGGVQPGTLYRLELAKKGK